MASSDAQRQALIDSLRQRFADFEPVRDLAQGSDGLMQLVQAVDQASITLADELGLQFFSHSINRQTFAN